MERPLYINWLVNEEGVTFEDGVALNVYDAKYVKWSIADLPIKEIRVRKDYEISITLNASFNQVEQLKAVSTYDGAGIFEEISEKGA